MTNVERIGNLQKLGYTEREAGFLVLAALHSGCFLRRQYNFFLGQEPGGAAERLVEKAVALGHLTVLPSTDRTRIYHLSSRPFYNVIDQEDNRNRRIHEPYAILQRLMGLDFVLVHRSFHYLATEQEKVEYFEQIVGIHRETLPTKLYTSPTTSQVTARYFVDKNPIFLTAQPDRCTPMVHFGYVDAGLGRPAGLETYLQQYRPLLSVLPAFALVYIARDPHLFERAERLFWRLAPASKESSSPSGEQRIPPRMLAYFEARQAFEAKRYDLFDQKRLDELREAQEAFREGHFEVLYQRWQQGGEAALKEGTTAVLSKTQEPQVTFSKYHSPYSYDFFGPLAKAV